MKNAREKTAVEVNLSPDYFVLDFQILKTRVDGVTCSCDGDLDVTVSSKNSELSWTFEVTTKKLILHNVALLNDTNRHHFSLITINHVGEYLDGTGKANEITKTYNLDTEHAKNNLQVHFWGI